MDPMDFDVNRVRRAFPALELGIAHFDGPGGSQVPLVVAEAVAATMTGGLANRGSVTDAERRADEVVREARSAVADLLGADPDGVVFARSMTQATFDLARTLSASWSPGDEVVVTRLDHDANIRPWVLAAERAGATVRWVDFDRRTADLTVADVEAVLGDRTRLIAVTGASNLIGTRPDVAAIAAAAHRVGALVHVDGVHLAPHAPVDVRALGADFFACSPYKFFGPHLGATVADPDLWEQLEPARLLPSSNAVPERFELGTLPYELLAGTAAAVDFIADLAAPSGGVRRERVLASMAAAEEHEERLFRGLLERLDAVDGVTLHGAPRRRTPTALFSVADRTPTQVHTALATHGVNAPGGSFYAIEASRWLGLGDAGAVRVGLAPYTDDDDIDRLVKAVTEVAP